MEYQVSIAQIEPKLLDIKVNEKKILECMKQSSSEGSSLVVFPEMSLTGYFVTKQDMTEELNLSIKESLTNIKAMSKELDLDVIVGYPLITDNGSYISSEYISKGNSLDIHSKVYLADYGWCEDHLHYKPGDKMTVIDTQLGRMAILVCEDGWHISTSLLAGQMGADVIIACSATSVISPDQIKDMKFRWETISSCMAMTQTCYFIYANRVGKEFDKTFWGGSHITSPDGSKNKLEPLNEGLLNAKIDLDYVKKWKEDLPLAKKEKNDFTIKNLKEITNKSRII